MTGSTSLVLITGAAEIGKTALLAEICRQAARGQLRATVTKCDEIEQVSPGAPVVAVLRSGRKPFRRGPLTGLNTLEAITAAWVHWYNTSRLMHRLDRRPLAEAEADYYAQTRDDQPVAHT